MFIFPESKIYIFVSYGLNENLDLLFVLKLQRVSLIINIKLQTDSKFHKDVKKVKDI